MLGPGSHCSRSLCTGLSLRNATDLPFKDTFTGQRNRRFSWAPDSDAQKHSKHFHPEHGTRQSLHPTEKPRLLQHPAQDLQTARTAPRFPLAPEQPLQSRELASQVPSHVPPAASPPFPGGAWCHLHRTRVLATSTADRQIEPYLLPCFRVFVISDFNTRRHRRRGRKPAVTTPLHSTHAFQRSAWYLLPRAPRHTHPYADATTRQCSRYAVS